MKTLNHLLTTLEVTERPSVIRLKVNNFCKRYFEFCKQLGVILKDRRIGELEVGNELISHLDFEKPYDSISDGLECTIKLTKANEYIFFTEKAAHNFLKVSADLPSRVFFYFLDEGFNSTKVEFVSRSESFEPEANGFSSLKASSGIKFTKPLSSEAIAYLPSDISAWLLQEESYDLIPEMIKRIFSVKLVASLSSEVIVSGDNIDLFFRGDRTVRLTCGIAKGEIWEQSFNDFQAIARWVFLDTNDADTRHTLFNNQLAMLDEKIVNDGQKLLEGLDKVLKDTILSYKYHLIRSSKDLNKLLTDLNKTLFEHVGKIRQNTSELIGALWRDFTTVFALLLLNFSFKKPDLPKSFWTVLLLGLILYLAVSFALTSRMGFWYYSSVKKSLKTMRPRIYGYLDNNDFDEYALDPLKGAFSKYRNTFFVILFFYIGMVSALYFLINGQSLTPEITVPSIRLLIANFT